MSRITGNDVANLMEAYSTVYAPQEVNEEQVWEEVENWVNSLVEEGHDLSEYTWEDMYDAYIEEQGARRGAAPTTSTTSGAVTTYAQPRPNTGQSYQSRFARPMNAGTPVSQGVRRGAAPSRVTSQIGSLPANYRGQELQQAAAARASQVGTTRQGTAGGPTVGGNTPIGPATRPAAQAPTAPARPAAQAPTAPARPAAQAPTAPAGPAATAPTQNSARPTATPAPRQRDTSISDMIGRSQIRQGAPINTGNRSSDIRSMALRGSVGATPTDSASKPNLQQQIRQRRLNMDLDLFDIVQGYLLDEGYAETEEAAAVIMANMSEEWKTQILESRYFPTKESQREDEAKYKKGGSEVKHRTAQTQARPTPSK